MYLVHGGWRLVKVRITVVSAEGENNKRGDKAFLLFSFLKNGIFLLKLSQSVARLHNAGIENRNTGMLNVTKI